MTDQFKFYPEAIRADKTGYFLIFEASDKGEREAERFAKKFYKYRFRKAHMYPTFTKRGSAVEGYEGYG
jgi:hypothetical protein